MHVGHRVWLYSYESHNGFGVRRPEAVKEKGYATLFGSLNPGNHAAYAKIMPPHKTYGALWAFVDVGYTERWIMQFFVLGLRSGAGKLSKERAILKIPNNDMGMMLFKMVAVRLAND